MNLRRTNIRRLLPAVAALAALLVATQAALAARPGGLLQRQLPEGTAATATATTAPAASRPAYQVAERSEAAQAAASAAPQLRPERRTNTP